MKEQEKEEGSQKTGNAKFREKIEQEEKWEEATRG